MGFCCCSLLLVAGPVHICSLCHSCFERLWCIATCSQAEAEPGPTDTPSEAGKDVGVNARTYGKGVGADDKDPAEWSDIVVKKEKVRGSLDL